MEAASQRCPFSLSNLQDPENCQFMKEQGSPAALQMIYFAIEVRDPSVDLLESVPLRAMARVGREVA